MLINLKPYKFMIELTIETVAWGKEISWDNNILEKKLYEIVIPYHLSIKRDKDDIKLQFHTISSLRRSMNEHEMTMDCLNSDLLLYYYYFQY